MMIEKIKELSDTTHHYVYENWKLGDTYHEVYSEKFAELIITDVHELL